MNTVEETSLTDECITLIRQRPYKITVKKISEATGLSESWINRLSANKLKNPPYNKLKIIKNFLENN